MKTIGTVMSRDVQLVGPDDTIRDAAELMGKIDAGVLPVAGATAWSG